MMRSPEVSVVIATCNRPHVLARTLDALSPMRLGVPEQVFEVIVADDSLATDTRELVDLRFPRARYVRGPGRGPASNRNRGALAAKGEWIAFIDDDCEPEEEWLRALRAAIGSCVAEVIEGRIVAPDKRDSPFSRHVENLNGGVFWSGNLCLRRETFDRLGRFDEDFEQAGGEDLELAVRIRRSGVKTLFCSHATVVHPAHAVSWRYLVWRFLLIRWHVLYLQKIGQGVPLDAPTWRAVAHVAASRVTDLLRATWKWARDPAGEEPRKAAFDLTTQWVLFPLLLPYLVYWDLRFRRLLRGRLVPPSVREDAVLDRGQSQ